MKRSLFLATAGVLLFTGCCKKLELVDCKEGCDTKVKTQKVNTIQKQPTIQSDNNCCAIKNGFKSENKIKKECTLNLHAKGVGVVPCSGSCSTHQAIAMARRAAVLDAYKALTEKLYGIKINGSDTVKNMILQNSEIKAYVEGVIRGAKIESEEFKNGIYSVKMSLKVDINEWNDYLKRNNLL